MPSFRVMTFLFLSLPTPESRENGDKTPSTNRAGENQETSADKLFKGISGGLTLDLTERPFDNVEIGG